MTIYKLKDLLNVVRGNSLFQKKDLKESGDFLGLHYGKTYKLDIVNDNFNYFVDKKFYKKNQVITKNDVVLITTSETIEELGKAYFYNAINDGLLGGEQIKMAPKNNKIINKYLYYWLKINFKNFHRFATGVKVFRIKFSDFGFLSIKLPKKNIQKQIIDIIEPHEKLFLEYSGCIRIDKPENTNEDIQVLSSIMNPILNLESKIKISLNSLKVLEEYLFQHLLKKTKFLKMRDLIVEKKENTYELIKPVSIGYNGIRPKIGRVPKKSKILRKWDFVVGLTSKKMPKALNIGNEIFGVSSAYKVFSSIDKNFSKSWFAFKLLEKNWKKYIKPTSRQGQGFDSKAFLNDSMSLPLEIEFIKFKYWVEKIMNLKNDINKFSLKLEAIIKNISYSLQR